MNKEAGGFRRRIQWPLVERTGGFEDIFSSNFFEPEVLDCGGSERIWWFLKRKSYIIEWKILRYPGRINS